MSPISYGLVTKSPLTVLYHQPRMWCQVVPVCLLSDSIRGPMAERLVSGIAQAEDLDLSLRPKRMADFVGQAQTKDNLNIAIQAAKIRGEPLDHVIIYGPPGLGKTTLAHIIAQEMEVNIRVTSGPAVERAGDMAAILTSLHSRVTYCSLMRCTG